MAIAPVQATYFSTGTTITSIYQAFASNNAAGNLIVVAIGFAYTSGVTISSVTDSRGNAYQVGQALLNPGGAAQAIYYAENIKAGANTVTVNCTPGVKFPSLRIHEYSGLATSNSLDVSAGASGSTTSMSSGATAATSVAAELVFGAVYSVGSVTSVGSGFTLRVQDTYTSALSEDKIVTSTGAQTATATQAGGHAYVMQVVTFKAAPAAGGFFPFF